MSLRRRDVVVFGLYPPMPGPASAATLEEVRALLAGGADVRVISPIPTAAHRHADLSCPAGAWRFAREAVGARRLIVHLDADLLGGSARRKGLPARVALAAALRSAECSTVHVPDGVTPAAGWSRLVLSAADEVVVDPPAGNETAAGPFDDVSPEPEPEPEREDRPAWDLGTEPTREEIEAEIGRRAAARRAARQPSAESGAAAAARNAAVRRLRAMPLLGPAPPSSARPFAGPVKRVVQRLVSWQVDPIIDHVNVLHQAFGAVEPRPEPGATPAPEAPEAPGNGR